MSGYNVWVGCLACYNEGRLVGDWFEAADCPTDEDAFNEAVPQHKKIRQLNPHEELWVFDHEGSPVDGEYSPVDASRYADWMALLHESEVDAFIAYVKHVGTFDEQSVENFHEAYQGDYSSDEDFAQQLADDLGLIPEDLQWPASCIDWAHAARELMYDYFSEDGHYFRAI